MFKSIYKDIEYYVKTGNSLDKIIIVNVAVYIFFFLVFLGIRIFNLSNGAGSDISEAVVRSYVALNADLFFDLRHPWVFFTHMFFHQGFFHLLFNMLILFFLGRITGDLLGDTRVFPLYIMAGLCSAIFYLTATNAVGMGGTAIGASGAIMGIVAAAGMVAPDFEVRLILLGRVKLKYVVLAFILIDVFSVANGGSNWGGSIGHLGGAAFGLFYIHLMRTKGVDMARPIINMVDNWKQSNTKKAPKKSAFKAKVVYNKAGIRKPAKGSTAGSGKMANLSDEVDRILEKIKEVGYDNLSAEEKETLFIASKKDN